MLDTYQFNHIQDKPTKNTIGMMNMRDGIMTGFLGIRYSNP